MKKNGMAVIVILLLVTWVIFDYTKSNSNRTAVNNGQQQITEEMNVGVQKGNIAPNFELETLNGNKIKLSDYEGMAVFLNFWATWCLPCWVEMPHMQKFSTDFADQDVIVLAVNLTDIDNRKNVEYFVSTMELTLPVLLDPDGTVPHAYELTSYPATFFIDRQGIIQEKYPGAITYEIMKEAIQSSDRSTDPFIN